MTDPSSSSPAPDDVLDLVLEKTIRVGEYECSSIHLEQPIVKDLREAARATTGIDAVCLLIERGSKQPRVIIDQLQQRDFQRCQDFLDRFSKIYPGTSAS